MSFLNGQPHDMVTYEENDSDTIAVDTPEKRLQLVYFSLANYSRLVSNCCRDSGTPQDPSPNSTA